MTMENKREQMLGAPVERLVCKMAVPTVITMLITAFYNMADTYFVGQLDTVSTAAVGLALPLMNIIQALGFFFGHGSGNYISERLGAGDTKAADVMGDTAAVLSLTAGGIICLAGLIFIRPLMLLLGASDEYPDLMRLGREYVSVLIIGAPVMMASFTMNNQLRFRGNAFLGMVGIASGSFLNVALDPLFIYVFGMGVKGAAAATVISQTASFFLLLKMSGRLPLRKPYFCLNSTIWAAIFRYGTPSLLRQGIMSAATMCLNRVAVPFGEAAVAAVSVVSRIVMVGASAVIGLGQGFQPVCGFNSGGGRYERVKKAFLFCIKFSTLFMVIFGLAVFVFADSLTEFFRDDPQVTEIAVTMLRAQCVTGILQGITVMTNMLLQNMGKTFQASVLAAARQGVFFIPLLYILTGHLGLLGLQITQSAADLMTAAVTLPMTISAIKELDDKSPSAP